LGRENDRTAVTRREFIQTGAAAGGVLTAGSVAGCGDVPVDQTASAPARRRQAKPQGRVIILGFDGVKPAIVESMIAAGELPHLAELQKGGSYRRLKSVIPPQSPPAWASFATCTSPKQHRIFDFVARKPARYMPANGVGTIVQPRATADGTVISPPGYRSNRRGKSFWKIASEQGMRVKVLTVPFVYPAEDLPPSSRQLCGLGVPDLRGNQSTYFAFSESFTKLLSVEGGFWVPLKFEGNTATLMVPGLRQAGGRKGEFAAGRLTLTKEEGEPKRLRITVQSQDTVLREREWSKWMEWTFAPTPKYYAYAISRFYLVGLDDGVKLYMTCLQYHPRRPFVPISSPTEYSSELADRYGLYKTIGWAYDTRALANGDMSDETFMGDVWRTMTWREQLTLDELDRGGFDILIAGWTATDRVSHVFWHCRDPDHPMYTPELNAKYGRAIEDTYIKADEIVGKVMERLRPDDLLMVLSDHGFHSFRTQFSVNTWLIRNGYLVVKGQTDPATAYLDERYLNLDGEFYDWSRTRAYGLGMSTIYLNLKGREGKGIVDPEDAPALLAELREKLMSVTDPDTDEKIFLNVYTTDRSRMYIPDNPDITLGYRPGYQTCNPSTAGAAPPWVFHPNDSRRWTGDHASSDVSISDGVLFSNRHVAQSPAIVDLGVTTLRYFDLEVPSHFEGETLL